LKSKVLLRNPFGLRMAGTNWSARALAAEAGVGAMPVIGIRRGQAALLVGLLVVSRW
jgi:hypothetical protein